MDVDSERVHEDDGDDVDNVRDIELLERFHLGNESDDDNEPPLEYGVDCNDTRDSDDETCDPANPDPDEYF